MGAEHPWQWRVQQCGSQGPGEWGLCFQGEKDEKRERSRKKKDARRQWEQHRMGTSQLKQSLEELLKQELSEGGN